MAEHERLERTAAWSALADLRRSVASRPLRDLLQDRAGAGLGVHVVGDLHIDLAKHWVDPAVQAALDELAAARGVEAALQALFGGARVNATEGRAAGHWALRSPVGASAIVDGVDVAGEVVAERNRAAAFADDVRVGAWRGATGAAITHVVNIGIGGSDLGPAMACRALASGTSEPDVRFVSNVDAAAFDDTVRGLDPARTIFIVCSKTFTTLETMANARAARVWVSDAMGEGAVARHFVAVSTAQDRAAAFGLPAEQVFGFWDWVGGRYSLWSSVGLAVRVAIGNDRFDELLAGAHLVDEHVRTAPIAANAAVQLALLRVWYAGHWGAAAHAVVPYAERLSLLPAHLQQLEMESLGKRATVHGDVIDGYDTGQIVFGSAGTDAQHAYFQLLHQGTRLVPVDFIGFALGEDGSDEQQRLLLANLLAQSAALAVGRDAASLLAEGVGPSLVPHRAFPGGRPSTVILAPALTPSTLGQLLALYEHTTYVQAVLWGVNAFDQFGVELGKEMATSLGPLLEPDAVLPGDDSVDAATVRLAQLVRSLRGGR
jgi:glucose-6-phosphate isomerase